MNKRRYETKINFMIDKKTRSTLEKEASKRGIVLSDLMRDVVKQYLSNKKKGV